MQNQIESELLFPCLEPNSYISEAKQLSSWVHHDCFDLWNVFILEDGTCSFFGYSYYNDDDFLGDYEACNFDCPPDLLGKVFEILNNCGNRNLTTAIKKKLSSRGKVIHISVEKVTGGEQIFLHHINIVAELLDVDEDCEFANVENDYLIKAIYEKDDVHGQVNALNLEMNSHMLYLKAQYEKYLAYTKESKNSITTARKKSGLQNNLLKRMANLSAIINSKAF